MNTFKRVLALCLVMPSLACSKGSGGSIGAPLAYPPTASVTPTLLLQQSGTSLLATFLTEDPLVTTIKSRLFSDGPTNLLQLVKNVDRRMADLDTQSQSRSEKAACLSATATDLSTLYTVPAASGTTTIPFFAQCQTTYTGPGGTDGGHVVFGNKDDAWYLIDGYTPSGVIGIYKVSGTSDANRKVDGYMVILPSDASAREDNFNGSTTLLHFYADAEAGTMEFTAGGVGIGFDQVHAKSDANYFYIEMESGGSSSAAATLTSGCFDKSTLAATGSVATCTGTADLAFSLTTLGVSAHGNQTGGGSTTAVPTSTANNVNLTTLNAGFITNMATAFSGVAAF